MSILLQATGETSERFFEWGALPPPWVVFLLVVPLVVSYVSFVYRRERPTGGTRDRSILGALRAVVLLLILGMLARPLAREIVYQTHDPHIMVLVDDSLSMKIQDKYGDRDALRRMADLFRSSPESLERMSRYDLVARLLRDREIRFLDSLRERGRVALWAFSGGLKKLRDFPRSSEGGRPGATPSLGEGAEILPEFEKIQGEERVKQTRIGDSLAEAVASAKGAAGAREEAEIASVILLSDGQHNAGALQPEDAARKLGQRGIPVYTVGVGNPEAPKDVRVIALDSSDVVLVGDRVPFDATVVADGFPGERVRVDLSIDGEVVDTEYLTLSGGGERQSVRLDHVPKSPGDVVVAVKVEPNPGELFEENNVASKLVKVLDQKIKVLYLEGPPRWEYRFLKNALIRDPTMEAQVLLFSADKDFIQESSPGIAPLGKFPGNREELFQHHVVIVGDVEPEHLSKEAEELLKDFVSEAGGGVVFIAGENSNPHRYLHTPLYQLLPVEVPEGIGGGDGPRSPTERFNVLLTGVGREHPVMRLDNDPERNRRLWENEDGIESNHLPAFYWFAEVNREKPGAVKLGVHPNPSRDHPIHGPRAIFAFQNFGKGRVFYSGVDNTWRWRAGVDNLYFYKFWGQAIRFVASGRLLGKTPRFGVTTDKIAYTIGEKVTIDCRVYDANMKPSTEETIKVYHQVEAPGQGGPQLPEVISLSLNKVKGPGAYEGAITAEHLGRHELWLGAETERVASRGFTVEVPALEYRDTRMNRDRLKRVADLSAGGKYSDLGDIKSLLNEIKGVTKPRQTPIDDRHEDLWDDAWVLFLITGLLAGEWIYRKMVKLL